jgi:hypothetical protein
VLAVWPDAFRSSCTIIIPKPHKPDYSKLKAYRPIVLLSCISKLAEKAIAAYMQSLITHHSLLHPVQCGGIAHHSTIDAGLVAVHHVKAAWSRRLQSTMLTFDIAQFFPSVPHSLLLSILRRLGFPISLCNFFASYLPNRTTSFSWNLLSSPLVESTLAGVGVGQGSVLSPLLSAISIVPVLYLISSFIPLPSADVWCSLLNFVDDGALILSSDNLRINNILLQSLYPDIARSFKRAGFLLEDDKLELIHFPFKRSLPSSFPGPSLTLSSSHIIHPKPVLRYLGFFFDQKLNFKHHINFYSNRALSTVRAYPMLGNSLRGATPSSKHLLYISCVLPILTYGFQLWFSPRHTPKTILKSLQITHSSAARWILGAFRTSPRGALLSLSGLMPIHILLRKQFYVHSLRLHSLPESHLLRILKIPKNSFSLSALSPFTSPFYVREINNPKLPLHVAFQNVSNNLLSTVHTHPQSLVGNRLLDIFHSQIHTHIPDLLL